MNFPFALKQSELKNLELQATHGSVNSADNQKHVALGLDIISERKRGTNLGKRTDTRSNNGDGSCTYIAVEMEY